MWLIEWINIFSLKPYSDKARRALGIIWLVICYFHMVIYTVVFFGFSIVWSKTQTPDQREFLMLFGIPMLVMAGASVALGLLSILILQKRETNRNVVILMTVSLLFALISINLMLSSFQRSAEDFLRQEVLSRFGFSILMILITAYFAYRLRREEE
jgi:FtsH-binding integral membrane protein